MKALVIGSDSTIGRRLAPALRNAGWQVHGTTRRPADGEDLVHLDLADPQCVAVRLPPVDVAFFCAAITRFSDCDADPALARQVNVLSSVALAERLAAAGTHAILLSSIAVYDGEESRVPAERPVNPNSLYGRLKADAEKGFLAFGGAASIVRLTKVLAPEMPLFNGWIDALAKGLPVSAFEDTGLAPVSIEAVVDILVRVAADAGGGIYQASARDDLTYVEAARHIAERLGASPALVRSDLGAGRGVPAEQLRRFSSLDTTRVDRLTGKVAPAARDVIDEVFSCSFRSASADAHKAGPSTRG
jgi:dTDP-4-dehydrorhamnose reductase